MVEESLGVVMKTVAWSSLAFRRAGMNEATYFSIDGREILVCEVASVPDDFVWPPKPKTAEEFHVDDGFAAEVPLTHRWGDLVFEGEVTRCIKSARYDPLDALDDLILDEADDFDFLGEDE